MENKKPPKTLSLRMCFIDIFSKNNFPMKNKTTSILLSIFYFVFCIFVIFHNASYRLDILFSGKYLVFMMLSIVVFFVLMKVVKEIFDEDGNDF
jgi:hypothetical protein